MTRSLPRALRSARLRVLATMVARIGDIATCRAAVDHAVGIVDDSQEAPDDVVATVLELAWTAAGQDAVPPQVPVDDSDEVLVLLAACCHSSLPAAARIALMLTVAGGLPTAEVARAFSVPDATMEQRLAWSQNRIRGLLDQPITPELVAARLGSVLDVLVLIFDDGIVHPRCHVDLPYEAAEMTRVVVELFAAEQEPRALMAIMLLTRARRDARQAEDGSLIPLSAQDRSLWHQDEIAEGLFLLRGSRRDNRFGPFQVRASIQAAHVTSARAEDTDWDRILALYDQLQALTPSDAVALGRAAALAEVRGAEAALETVERLDLDSHLFHATRADLLGRLGRQEEADRAWTAAVSRVRGASEHARLRGHLDV